MPLIGPLVSLKTTGERARPCSGPTEVEKKDTPFIGEGDGGVLWRVARVVRHGVGYACLEIIFARSKELRQAHSETIIDYTMISLSILVVSVLVVPVLVVSVLKASVLMFSVLVLPVRRLVSRNAVVSVRTLRHC